MHNDASGRDQDPGSSQGRSVLLGRLLPRLPRYLGSNYGHGGRDVTGELLDTHHCQICIWISDVKGSLKSYHVLGQVR
jgi:hypothetical protein